MLLPNENSSLDGELIAKKSDEPRMTTPRMVRKGVMSTRITCQSQAKMCSKTRFYPCSCNAVPDCVCVIVLTEIIRTSEPVAANERR